MDDGGSKIISYLLESSEEGSGYKWRPVDNGDDGYVPDTKYTPRNLKPKANYRFRVAAKNRSGLGPYSESDSLISRPIGELEKINKTVFKLFFFTHSFGLILAGEAPRVTRPLRDVTVISPEVASFELGVTPGAKDAEIKWRGCVSKFAKNRIIFKLFYIII